MLLNLSNHPSTRWTKKQLDTAINQYNSVQDLQFPNIEPEASKKEVKKMVKKYVKQIAKLHPKAVHLMGEMTFTYALVQKLKKANIPCVASTSNRIVEEIDGKKIVQFQFVQFREY